MKKNYIPTEIKNKEADFQFFLLQKWTAGIALTGTEIKSIKQGKCNLKDAFCQFKSDELWLKNMHISEYDKGTYLNHLPTRERKLLLRAKELSKLQSKVKERGHTIIPVRIFFSDRGFAKVEIALAKGKKNYDKRNTIKQKESQGLNPCFF
jgi:SsrA-binding protein